MRVALLGTRGIPANYGGFETFAEELSWRLVERGHSVTVYCRERYAQPSYRGVQRAYLPTIRHKYFDTIAHTCLSSLHLLTQRCDVALYCNGANAIFCLLPRMRGIPVALNVDGLERKRKKWNALARGWYLASEWLSPRCATQVISDAEQIAAYYRERYRVETVFIPYGAEVGPVPTEAVLHKLGLQPRDYFLYVTRMEPENNPLLVREAFEQTAISCRLVLVGDAPYAHAYIQQVRNTQDPRVLLPGAIYGQGYQELQSHCWAYVHATEVGGTHPALIEAMGRGALVLYLDTAENAEVAGDAAIPFQPDTLPQVLEQAHQMSVAERDRWGQRAMNRVRERYSWDAVTVAYEQLLTGLAGKQK